MGLSNSTTKSCQCQNSSNQVIGKFEVKIPLSKNDIQLQQGLLILQEGVDDICGTKLTSNVKLQSGIIILPLNASIKIGKEQIFFASICAVTYGINTNTNEVLDSCFSIFQHQQKWNDGGKTVISQKDVVGFTISSSQEARLITYALTYLVSMHRDHYQMLYASLDKRNIILLNKKLKYTKLLSTQFKIQYNEYKAKGGDLESYTDLLANLCDFLKHAEYIKMCNERFERAITCNQSLVPILKGKEIKSLLKELLDNAEPELDQAKAMLGMIASNRNRIHINGDVQALLDVLLPSLQLIQKPQHGELFGFSMSVKEQLEPFIEQFLTEHNAEDEDKMLQQLQDEIVNENITPEDAET